MHAMFSSKNLRRGLTGTVLAASLLFNSGCLLFVAGAAAGAAAGTVAYVDGELDASLGQNYDAVVRAANLAIDQMQFSKPEEQKDSLTDTLTTHTAKGDKVSIVLTRVNDNSTKVQIRVGVFGDETTAQAILDKIKSNLPGGS
jgi:hypothetical protein